MTTAPAAPDDHHATPKTRPVRHSAADWAKVSRGLGGAMVRTNVSELPAAQPYADRGW